MVYFKKEPELRLRSYNVPCIPFDAVALVFRFDGVVLVLGEVEAVFGAAAGVGVDVQVAEQIGDRLLLFVQLHLHFLPGIASNGHPLLGEDIPHVRNGSFRHPVIFCWPK